MNAGLFHGFENELAAITDKLATQRAALEGFEDEERAVQRQRIAATEVLLQEVTDARNKIASAESRAEETVSKFVRWREAVAKTREALEAVEKFVRPIEETQAQIDAAENNYEVARAALTHHRNNPIPNADYASQATVRQWEKKCEELEATLNARSADLRALKQHIAILRRDWLKATDHFNACAFTERQLKPRTPERPAEGFGSLSAVS